MESPDTKDGSPIAIPVTLKNAQGKDEEFYMVLAGNGRFRALDKIDADNRGDEYRNPIKLFADEKGIPYKPEEMTADAKPRLVRVMTKKPVNVTHQEIALLSNQESILQKTDAEKASTDAELIERDGAASLFSANKDGLPSKSGSDEFFAWFVRATGDKSLKDSQGNPTAAARERARRAMLAVAIGKGKGGKETVMVFTETADALGLERQRDALLMAAGTLSALEGNKPDYGLSNDLSRAAASILAIARDRKAGKTIDAETFIKQGDLLDPIPQAVAELIRILDANRPAEGISETFRRYAELASRIDTDTPDMFGEPPAPKHELLKKAQADTEIETGGRYSITSDKLVDRVRYSIALAARRYSLATNMPKEGEQEIAKQLEFLFARQIDPDYAEKMDLANRKRQATKKANQKAKEDARLTGISESTAWALANPNDSAAWDRAFEKSGNTVSRIIHDFFNPQENHFPHSVNGVPLVGLKVETTQDLASLFMPLRNPYQESIKVAFLDDNNVVVGAQLLTVGLLDQTQVDPRLMFRKAYELGATGYVFSHNHPSGNPNPSSDDIKATDRMKAAGDILGFRFVDHIITNGRTFYSLKNKQLHQLDKAITPAWESISTESTTGITSPLAALDLVNTLRQGNGDFVHAILLDTKNQITGVHRVTLTDFLNKPGVNPTAIARSVYRAAAENPTKGIILDLTADQITPKDVEEIKRVFSSVSITLGIPVLDYIHRKVDEGTTFVSDKSGAFITSPKNQNVAESSQPWTRYSVSSDAFAWIRDFNDESFGDEEAGPARDTRERLAVEFAEIEAQHTNPNGTRKDSWMKAPNGRRTDLDERQWVLVRTPSFKKWFGDWENDKENSSKVIDSNGEPLVVYHGTREAGFSEFMMSTDWEADGEGLPLGHYFSSRATTAYTYSGSFDFAKEFVEVDERGKPIDIYPAIYPTFLNIRNIQTYDYDGAAWNRYKDEETGKKETTRTLAKRALKAHADGVLFKNVIDNGGEGSADDFMSDPDDVYVVFSNNDIKSAEDNVGSFSPLTDDIRYSIQPRLLEPMALPDSMAEVFTSTSVSALSQTKFKVERAQHKSFREIEDWDAAEAYARTLIQKKDTLLLGQYLLAKYHGDNDCAKAVVDKWAKPSEALRLKSVIGDMGLLKPVITAAITQREGNHVNKIPAMYAAWIAQQIGGYTAAPMLKIKGNPNTNASMGNRINDPAEFIGGDDIDSVSPVIMVDDVLTSGNTMWTAYETLKAKNPNANVVAFAALAFSRFTQNIRPTQKQLTGFWKKSKLTTTSFKERIGNDIAKLTGTEIQAYILTGAAGPDGATKFFTRPDGRGEGSDSGGKRGDGMGSQSVRRPDLSQIRYSLDITGAAYNNDPTNLVKGWMAAQLVAGNSFPSKVTVQRLAQQLGIESFDYQKLADEARWLEQNAVDNAIRKAATSGDSQKAIYAVGELARKAAYVRSGMREGVKLAGNTDRIRALSDEKARKAIQLITGADYADIEIDTGIDIAATILSADPSKFHPEEEKKQTATSTSGATAEDNTDSSPEVNSETDEEAPGLTDKQRAEIARKRREREERIQAILDQATRRGEHNRKRDDERKLQAAANQKADAEEQAAPGANHDGASGVKPAVIIEDTTPASPINFADRFEAAAFLRLWAFDRFRRENPNSLTNPNKDKTAIEFYRKTAVKELNELARKLLEPGYKREIVLGNISDIVAGLTANQIERRTAYVFGLLNRYAVREERKTLVKSFRAEVKRQFVKGEHFEELGIDLGRTLTGAIEEDARYVMKVCEMSERQLEGETSTLQRERDRLNAIIDERTGLTDMDGNPVSEESGDMSLRKALRQLALLDQYGGMVDMMPGEIMDLSGKALDAFAQEAIALHQRWEEYDKIVKAIKEPLSLAISRKPDDPVAEASFLGSLADSLTGMLRMRLDFLTRYADPAKREAGRAAIADIMDLLARGNTEYVVSLQEDEVSLNKALGEILQKPDGSPDRRRMRAYLKRMDEKIPHELSAALSKQGLVGRMTYGQMLQLLVSLDQTASYGDNIKLHDRQGQADLIRSFAYADPKTGETRRALSNEDAQLVEWLRRSFYPSKRETISEVTTRLAGRPVDNPDPFYAPIKLLLQKKTALHVGSSAWQPLSGVFSRRVKNKLDFDEKASILDIFKDRSRETALLIAFSERGIILREIMTSGSFQGAVTRFHGQAALTGILKQVEQTLNGGRTKTQSDAQTAAASMAMKVTTYTGLGWNMQSAMKQTASLPVFANKIGFKKLFSILAKPVDKDAIRILKESDEYRVRYGTGSSSGMDIATKGAYENPKDSVFKKFFGDWGLWANRKTDWIMSAWVGQGVFRDLKASYMDKGMSEADAERRAISETFSMIEETQQSGRTENTLALTREHGILGKMLTQFATSPLQQMQYEIKAFREWRDLVANQGPEENIKEARDHFMRATFINHVIVPALMTGISSLYKAATGDEPDWKKEGFWWTLLIASIMGQFSRVLFLGAFTEQTLRAFFLRERPNLGQLVPAEGVIRFSATMAYPVRDIVTWDMEHLQADVKRMLKSTAVTRLPTKLYENMTDEK
jgi:DNA repair protein RadC/predicted amidophosphoribosyltransferase